MIEYLEFVFQLPPNSNTQFFIEKLDDLGFDSIWEDEDLKAYLAKPSCTEEFLRKIDQISSDFGATFTHAPLPNINWNQEWESQFDPVEIDDYCRIRASFHPHREGWRHEILIDPKMSFGTGHHATTFMMVQMMSGLDFQNKKVLDFGSGTGVLAILAAKLGARAEGVEIEEIAVENSIENAQSNKVNVEFFHGGLEKAAKAPYDIVLANINRNVILDSLEQMKSMTKQGGFVLISGILEQDQTVIQNAMRKHNYLVADRRQRGDWLCYLLRT